MKYEYSLIVIFALALRCETLGANVLSKNCAMEQVQELLTMWRNGAVLPFLLPSLDVIKVNSVNDIYEGFGIKITYTTGDMQLTGVSKFTVKDLYVSTNELEQTLEASTTVHFPLLTLIAEQYKLKGRAYLMYSLKGAGLMNVTFQNVDVMLGISLAPKGTATEVHEITLNFKVGNVEIYLADSSWPINKVLNSNGMKIIENHRDLLVTGAKEQLKHVLNDNLVTITPAQVLSLASNDYCTYPILS